MEGFSLVDIYATKGIEYLIVIGFLAAFVIFSRYLRTPATTAAPGNAFPEGAGRFRVPECLHYHRGHTWLKVEPDNLARAGLDDFAQKLIGRIDAVELPPVGTKLVQGEKAWSVKAGGKSIPMLSPADGEVVAVNAAVSSSPDLLRADPYEGGWLLKIRAPRLPVNTRNLFCGKLARKWMEDTLEKLQPPDMTHLGPVLQDGGLPVDGLGRILYGENWDEAARKHFLTDGE